MRLEVGPTLSAGLLPAGTAAEDAAEEITEVPEVANVEVEAADSAEVTPLRSTRMASAGTPCLIA